MGTATPRAPLTVEHALLGWLRRRPAHAYELYALLRREPEFEPVWRLKQSHLYALLARLEAEGLVASETEPQPTRPARHILRLTPAGDAALRSWMATPVAHGRDVRLEFLAKLYFAADDGPATALELIRRQRDTCAGWLAALDAQIAALADDRRFDRLVIRFRRGQIAAMIEWLDACARAYGDPA